MNPLERTIRAVIWLESSTELGARLVRLLNWGGSGEVRLASIPENGSQTVAVCQKLAPALLVIGEGALRRPMFDEVQDLLDRRELQMLVLASQTDDVSQEGFFQRGCVGVLPADVPDAVLLKAIQAICTGELWMSRRVLSKLALTVHLAQGSARRLTKKESEVLALIRSRLTNDQIAERLFISRETVRWHIRNLNAKMGADSRMIAVGGDGDRAGAGEGAGIRS